MPLPLRRIGRLLTIAGLWLAALPLAAQDRPALPPPPRGFGPGVADMVVDAAGVLSAESVARINALALAVKTGSGGEFVVVTLPDLEGRDVGDVALRIGREWKVGSAASIGDRSRNAGVVILLVPRETSKDGRGWISIQVGQGAEGFLTDGQTGDIRREATPLLQARNYSDALTLMSARVAERYAQEFGFSLDTALVPKAPVGVTRQKGFPVGLIILAFFVLVSVLGGAGRGRRRHGAAGVAADIALAVLLSGRRGGGGGGGFGGGGFGGFGGGGGFSGGGSSGSF